MGLSAKSPDKYRMVRTHVATRRRSMSPPRKRIKKGRRMISGTHAIIGMDIVSYSTYDESDQFTAIQKLTEWVQQALKFNGIDDDDFIWSHGGDGGYLTFASKEACSRAIDVAFSIFDRSRNPGWKWRSGEPLKFRMALHCGTVQESQGLGLKKGAEVCGYAINTTARILSISHTSQLLVSKQYFDNYVKDQRESHFEYGKLHTRSVKHGQKVEVMNVSRGSLGFSPNDAEALQWQAIGGLWKHMVTDYELLLDDSLKSGSTLAAIAAAKFLLNLNEVKSVERLTHLIGMSDHRPTTDFAIQPHPLFAKMTPDVLMKVIERGSPRFYRANDTLCQTGDLANTCFFLVSGNVVIERPGHTDVLRVSVNSAFGFRTSNGRPRCGRWTRPWSLKLPSIN
jgi:hypothetical protein